MTESQEPERSTEPRSAPGKFVVGKLKRRRTMIVSIKTQVHHKFQNVSLNLWYFLLARGQDCGF